MGRLYLCEWHMPTAPDVSVRQQPEQAGGEDEQSHHIQRWLAELARYGDHSSGQPGIAMGMGCLQSQGSRTGREWVTPRCT